MKSFFISIRQGNVLIANKTRCDCKPELLTINAVNLMEEVAENWNISPSTCSWAVYERLESITPLITSNNWNKTKL